MDRNIRILLGLAERLDHELEKREDLFFLERPWLWDNLGIENPSTDDLKERRRQNDENIEHLIEEIKKVTAPKPIKAFQDELFKDEQKKISGMDK